MKIAVLMVAATAAFSGSAVASDPAVPAITFSKVWTHNHSDIAGQVSETLAFDRKTNTLWVAGVVGVDVLDAATGGLVEHIDITAYGAINSVAIHNGLAAFAVEAAPDRRNPGMVLFYDTRTRLPSGSVNAVPVGPLPDMVTFTHDGLKLLVANEGTPNAVADRPYVSPDPVGSVSIIDVESRTVIATPVLAGVPVGGDNTRTNTGMDFEPEYIAVDEDDKTAYDPSRRQCDCRAGSQASRVHQGDRPRREGFQPAGEPVRPARHRSARREFYLGQCQRPLYA